MKGLKQNVILAKYTTYKIGGVADYFFVARNVEDLKNALRFAEEKDLKVFILAGGSNVLFSDEGFRGFVIKIDIKDSTVEGNEIKAGAGILMVDLVNKSVGLGLKGLEWAAGLPGTLGGAIRGNAGCFGGEIKNLVQNVRALEFPNEKEIEFSNNDCQFDYRDSIFKRLKNTIILNAVLKLEPADKEKLKKEAFEHIKYRQLRQWLPSCGCVFKNIPTEKISKKIIESFKGKIKNDPFPIIPAAALIEAVGLKGKIIGGAKITEEHTNIILNAKNAKASDVLALINLVKETIKDKFSVELEEEVQLVGFND